jgi:hypothetical protein
MEMNEHNWVHHLDKCTHECLYCGLEITDRTLVNARGNISPCEVSSEDFLRTSQTERLAEFDRYLAEDTYQISGWWGTTEEGEDTCICFVGRSRFCEAHDV